MALLYVSLAISMVDSIIDWVFFVCFFMGTMGNDRI